ncbi:MAG TPA: porin [Burkholderiaceae bacterium]|nr:porin [Burkholderiaceae bacterium]
MKLKLIAAATLLASAGAYAQSSVTVYGIVDAGVMSQSKTGATGTGGRDTAFVDAQMLPSIYGFKGSEDLGGGLKAGFQLEGGFNTGNGSHNSPGVYQNQLFGREAKVTLGGEWGSVGLGLQVDPALIAAIGTEPRGMTDSLSSLESWILATVGNSSASSNTSLQGGIFDSNSVTYTYSGNGLFAGVEYGFGGIAGSTSANSTASIGLSYTMAGFTGSAGYAEAKNANAAVGGKSSGIDFVGLGYSIGMFAVRAQYGDFKTYDPTSGAQASNVKDLGIGFDLKTGANKVNLAYYDSKDSVAGGKTKEIALADFYSLSKRTELYAQIASVKADANAGLSAALGGVYVPSGLTASAGVTTTYIGLGVQHLF